MFGSLFRFKNETLQIYTYILAVLKCGWKTKAARVFKSKNEWTQCLRNSWHKYTKPHTGNHWSITLYTSDGRDGFIRSGQRDKQKQKKNIIAGGKSSGQLFRSRIFFFFFYDSSKYTHLVHACIVYYTVYTFCRQIAYFRTLSLINNRKKSDVWSGGCFFFFIP